MTWIQDNAEHLLAALGAAYTLVRVVVWLTPTTKDDEFLAQARPWLTKAAGLFGLDVKQGRQVDDAS